MRVLHTIRQWNENDNWYKQFLYRCIDAINIMRSNDVECLLFFCFECAAVAVAKKNNHQHKAYAANSIKVISINWKGRENHVVNKTVYISIGLWHRNLCRMHTYQVRCWLVRALVRVYKVYMCVCVSELSLTANACVPLASPKMLRLWYIVSASA